MADMIQFKYGLQSAYDGVKPKGTSTMYLITDTHRVYLGETLLADHNVDFVTQSPSAEEAKDGVLYVVTTEEGTSIVTKGQDGQVITVGGGEASKYKEGSITFEALSSDSVATEISPDAASDSKLATESAVQKYVDGVKESLTESIKSTLTDKIVVGVKTGGPSSEDPNKIGLHFSTKKKNAGGTAYEDGDEIVIDLDKEKFLQSAKLEEDGKTLTLEMTNGDKFTIDLAQLVADATTVKTKEKIEVQLGDKGTLGGYTTGDEIAAGTSIEQVIKKLLAKQVPPTYTKPTVTIANNGGTASGNIEIGTQVTPKVRATFNQNDAGALTNIQFKKAGANAGEAQTESPADYTEEAFQLTAATTFTATATYGEGAVKKDNLGDDYPTGHIEAGSVTSGDYTFTPYRQGYFWGVLDSDSSTALTSAIIRSGTAKNGAYAAGNIGTQDVPVIKASLVESPKRIFVACPATNKGVTKVTMPSAMNADATSDFKKGEAVTVEGAAGYEGISYNVWVYEPAEISSDQTFVVTLG